MLCFAAWKVVSGSATALMTVEKGHAIARDLERWLCGQYGGLADVVIHVEPDDEDQRSRSAW